MIRTYSLALFPQRLPGALESILHVLRRKYQEWGYDTDKSEVDDILDARGYDG